MTNPPRILGLVCSYREQGTTETLVLDALEAARAAGARTELIRLRDHDVNFCTNCRECMQAPGEARGACIFEDRDDVAGILDLVERADGLVIGAPVNFGDVNAMTRQFLERCAGYARWPWGTQGAPELRRRDRPRSAVLMVSSGAPAFLAWPVFGVTAVRTLRVLADLLGARVMATLRVGYVLDAEATPTEHRRRQAARLGRRLAERAGTTADASVDPGIEAELPSRRVA
jgi:putative NADPH-quinone reductase